MPSIINPRTNETGGLGELLKKWLNVFAKYIRCDAITDVDGNNSSTPEEIRNAIDASGGAVEVVNVDETDFAAGVYTIAALDMGKVINLDLSASTGDRIVKLQNASAGTAGKQTYVVYDIGSVDLSVTTVGGTQTIKGKTSQRFVAADETFTVTDDTTKFLILSDSRERQVNIYITTATYDLTSGMESKSIYYTTPPVDTQTEIELQDPSGLDDGVYGRFRLDVNNGGKVRVFEDTTGFAEKIITPFKAFTVSVSNGEYKVIQDSRPTAAELTGIITGLEITGDAGETTFSIGAGSFRVNRFVEGIPVSVVYEISATDFVDVDATNIGLSDFTYLVLDENKSLTQSQSLPTDQELNTTVYIGNLTHIIGAPSFIADATNAGNMAYRQSQQMSEINLRQGTRIISDADISFDQANLDFTIGGGRYFRSGINRIDAENDPHDISIVGQLLSADCARIYSNGSTGITAVYPATAIDPQFYDDGSGTLAATTVNKFTRQRVFAFPSTTGLVAVVSYGKVLYNSLDAAVNSPESADFSDFPFTKEAAVSGTLVIKRGTTDLTAAFAAGDAFWLANIKEETVYRQQGSTSAVSSGATGEANTASNAGTAGVSIYETKAGVDLQFRAVESSNSSLTAVYAAARKTVDFAINLANANVWTALQSFGSMVITGRVSGSFTELTVTTGTVTPNFNIQNQWFEATENITWAAPANSAVGARCIVYRYNDSTGGYTDTLNAAYKTVDDAGYEPTAGADTYDIITLVVNKDSGVDFIVQKGYQI